MQKLTSEQKIQKAMIRVLREDPFFAAILLRLKVAPDHGQLSCQTIGTNGEWLLYNPQFIESLKDEALAVILKHEAMHVAFGHHIRLVKKMKILDLGIAKGLTEGDDRTFELSQKAGDLAVNSLLLGEQGFPKTMKGVVAPGLPGFEDMPKNENAELYYDRLEKKQDDDKPGEQSELGPSEDSEGGGGEGGSAGNEASDSDVHDQDDGASQDAGDRSDRADGSDSETGGDSDSDSCGGSSSPGDSQSKADDGVQGDRERGPVPPGDDDQSSGSDNSDGSSRCQHGLSDETRDNPFGTIEPAPVSKENPIEKLEAEWQRVVALATVEAKEAGKMPGFMQERVDEILGVAQVPWEQQLRPFLTEVAKTGFSYTRPNRRRQSADIIMPSNLAPTLGKVIFGVDTSGSMSQADMNLALPELDLMLASYREAVLQIVMIDTCITDVRDFDQSCIPIKADQWEWKGRGGTNFRPFFDHCRKEMPDLVIMLTDGYPNDSWFPEFTQYPLLWLMTTEITPKWGHVIKLR